MNWFNWIVVAACTVALPFELRRFYRNAKESKLSWWNVFDIIVSVTLIAAQFLAVRGAP